MLALHTLTIIYSLMMILLRNKKFKISKDIKKDEGPNQNLSNHNTIFLKHHLITWTNHKYFLGRFNSLRKKYHIYVKYMSMHNLPLIVIGVILPLWTIFKIPLLNLSFAKQKRKEKRWSPCLSPFARKRNPNMLSFTLVEKYESNKKKNIIEP